MDFDFENERFVVMGGRGPLAEKIGTTNKEGKVISDSGIYKMHIQDGSLYSVPGLLAGALIPLEGHWIVEDDGRVIFTVMRAR